MLKYIVKRLLMLIPVLLAVSLITFILGSMSSGDTARTLAEKKHDRPTQAQIEEIRVQMGFDRPVLVQYIDWFEDVFKKGNLGISYSNDEPVVNEMARYFPKTLKLALTALIFLVVIAFTLGILSAVFPESWIDRLSRLYCFCSVSIPEFWLGLILLYVFGVQYRLVPVLGGNSSGLPIIPALTISICSGGIYVRLVKTNMEEVLDKGFIRAARARGVHEYKIVTKHALKNAILPVLNKLGMGFGSLLAGSAIVESVFSWNGLGKFALESVKLKDYPVVQGYVLFMAVLIVLINLIVDIICGIIDPRLKKT
ncbi:nickel ABC transporter permease [Desulfoscipio sp. XC116]|uniref:nickel ABC transporter permease n=1 Tax=Desulfoscipio sp. XC116 TaxID=3144975 RepID=UPI00325B96EB